MNEIRVRPMSDADVGPSIELVMTVFEEFVAPDFGPEGVASFTEWANPEALADRLRGGCVAHVAVEEGRIVGVIEWMLPDHVAMLFVDPTIQGEGIGRRLFGDSLRQVQASNPNVRTVRVHASRYAVSYYHRLGFRETAPAQEQDGICYTPMSLKVKE